jgi:DNA invertase Pin-like site-specific DNA recombinase
MDWVRQRGYSTSDLIWFRDEGISGAKGAAGRAGYASLLAEVMSGKLHKILVFETSRVSRDFFEYLRFIDICRKNSCSVEVVGKGEIGVENSQDLLIASIHAFLGAAEREKISQRTRSGLANAKAKGVKLGRPKVQPGKEAKSGWRKAHDEALVNQVLELVEMKVPYRKITSILNSAAGKEVVSPAKISRIVNAAKAS